MNYLLFRIIFLSLLGLVNLFFVLFILVKKKGHFDHVSFDIFLSALFSFLFVVTSALYNIYFSLGHETLALTFARLSWIGGFLSSSFLVLVMDLAWSQYGRLKKYIISYVPVFSVFILALATDKVFVRFIVIRGVPVVETTLLNDIGRIIIFLEIAVGIFILKKYFSTTYGYKRKQLSYFIYGTVIYGLGVIFFGTFIPMFIRDLLAKDLIYDSIMLFTAVWIGFLAYAIIKYKLLEIETIFHKTMMWFTMSISILLPLFI
ncbi:MAG: hypothetical protein PHF84_04725, partial [bacterium]|nr:hypothetical protein [bacterium]